MINFDDILDQYNSASDNELEKIPIIAEQIAERIDKHKQLRWTKFPDEFRKCKTDASLKAVAECFNEWITTMGLYKGEK